MILKEYASWLWQTAGLVAAPGKGKRQTRLEALRALKRRLGYLLRATRLKGSLQAYMHPRAGSLFERTLNQRPELAGAVVWPYVCTSWSAEERLRRIVEHYDTIEHEAPSLSFPLDRMLNLIDLSDTAANLRIVLDQPKWFMREGLLAINLFLANQRIYTLAFSLARESGGIVAHVGAIQGVDVDGIEEKYKDLTKALHGMRPRDFLVEAFRALCRSMKITRIHAVDDAKRQHRSRYFGTEKPQDLFVNYNEIWRERGGISDGGDFFTLPLDTPMKPLEEIPSKKRAMYRRRYELLRSIESGIQAYMETNA